MALVNLRMCLLNKIIYSSTTLKNPTVSISPSLLFKTKYCSSISSILQYDRDPGPQFINPEVQKLLKSMTRMQLNKIFRKRTVPDNSIEYKFMTTEQLEEEFTKAIKRAEYRLQMPPVVKIKEDVCKVISEDKALKNFSDSDYVIADITYGLKQSERKVVIRKINGALEYAPHNVTKRINQIYFPINGRKIRTPNMFKSDEYLKECLNKYNYEFIMDRLCIQYEPYEIDYHRISSKVYLHINEHKQFDLLRSTRHFGPMVFFYAWHNIIDDLLYDMIKRDYLLNGVELICLLYILNNVNYDKSIHKKFDNYNLLPHDLNALNELKKSANKNLHKNNDIHEEIKNAIGKTDADFEIDNICLEFIEDFVKNKALKKVQLELAIQSYKEANDEKRKLYYGLKKAHGLN